jgi:ABC-type arginine transport system permease subunit
METLVSDPKNLEQLYQFYIEANIAVLRQIDRWHLLNVAFQVLSVALGVVATLMMALQSDKNQRWTKPIGIIATTLITGIVTVYTVFHIRENLISYLIFRWKSYRTQTI